MYGFVIAFALVSANPISDLNVESEKFDIIELNHYYDENGIKLLDQIIFYRWSEQRQDYLCEGWRLFKKGNNLNFRDGIHEFSFREGAITKKINSERFMETYTQYDKELLERRKLPRELRVGLSGELNQKQLEEIMRQR